MRSAHPTLLAFVLLALATLAARATDLSDQVLAELNLARTQPQLYALVIGQRMGEGHDALEAINFLQKARPLSPLLPSMGLEQASLLHVSTQGPAGGRGHGHGWNTPFSRMDKFGQWIGTAGENVFYGRRDARGIVCALIVDSGVSGRGHRKNIFSPGYGVAGVACGFHAGYGAMCVIDFAGRYLERGERMAGL